MEELTLECRQDPAHPGTRVLKVAGEVSIGVAGNFKGALIEALSSGSEVQVDVSALTGIDLTGLQLLCAAHHSAGTAGKELHIVDGGNPTFRDMATSAGFRRHTGCAYDRACSCIWVGGDN
ncbi:STAS domain-containing protein [Geomonas ferrireducens]|jgi:anti-anti-sigma regulatory factor|uniref:STAS domain-containing protein n=1 Tax=Geomonas ferrireducens TaxID=2570227 RepID=UPI0010A93ACE|nr:STAS domain-containing protein [Geomonas ferrireducens]